MSTRSKTLLTTLTAAGAAAALVLTGCSAGSTATDGNGAPANVEKQQALFEFQVDSYGADSDTMTIQIPDGLIEAAGRKADGLLVTAVQATARALDSSSYCAIDLAVTYAGDGLDILTRPKLTKAEWSAREESNIGEVLVRQFGVSTVDEAQQKFPERAAEIEEILAVSSLGPYDPAVIQWDGRTTLPIAELDDSAPERGRYISTDGKTLTSVQKCALSPSDDAGSSKLTFPVATETGTETFASVELSVMKSGALTVVDSDVAKFQRDSNGDWIAN
jgi:hypothetical protein